MKEDTQKINEILLKLSKSPFRASFKLNEKEKQYAVLKGEKTIKKHAMDFIEKRISPAFIPNDGKQTPMKNHPVFIAQHATATCCRNCLSKWHNIPKGRELTNEEKEYIVKLITEWIRRQLK